jgi:hypothetical protein
MSQTHRPRPSRLKPEAGLGQAKIREVEDATVRKARCLHCRSSTALNRNSHGDNVRTCLTQCLNRREHTASGGGGVLHGDDASASDIRTFDASLQAVRLLTLAYNKGVQDTSLSSRGVEHRGAHRIRTQRQPTDGVKFEIVEEVEHHAAQNRCGDTVEGHAPQVHVVVGLTTRRQDNTAVHDCLGDDLCAQRRAIVGLLLGASGAHIRHEGETTQVPTGCP